MKQIMVAAILAAGLGVVAIEQRADGQVNLPGMPQNPYVQPAMSPYLNMNRGGVPAINYFGLVKPQVQTAQQLQNLQMQQAQMMQLGFGATEETNAQAALSQTGHGSQFFNYGHFYGAPGGGVKPAQPMVSGMPIKKQ
jgi:hypothetical protein